jgi:predicted nuclease of restriction endonuclease-like (RecB) superfamily
MAISKNKYGKWLADLKQNINQQQLQTALQVNSNMLIVYWYLGKEINEKIVNEGWGKGVVAQLSNDLKNSFSTTKGYSVRSLEYMQQFAKEYPNLLIPQQAVAELSSKKSESKNNKNIITQQPVALIKNSKTSIPQQPVAELENTITQIGNTTYIISNPLITSIPWGHHTLLLDKIKEVNERIWYVEKTVNNNWSRNVLQYQIDTDLYTRQYKKKKSTNFHLILPKLQSDLANEIIKDSYTLEFIGASEKLNERQLEEKIIKHIEDFLIELGAGFAFVGRQYKLKLGRKEYFIDLLFYHLHLRSYIVIELKMGEFEMAHTGQLNGYLNYINKKVKNEFDNPTIGIILCGSKDAVEVDFALESINHPIGVSEYKYMKKLPKKYQEVLPTAALLKEEIERYFKQNKKK